MAKTLRQITTGILAQWEFDTEGNLQLGSSLIFVDDQNGDLTDSVYGQQDEFFEINEDNEITPQV